MRPEALPTVPRGRRQGNSAFVSPNSDKSVFARTPTKRSSSSSSYVEPDLHRQCAISASATASPSTRRCRAPCLRARDRPGSRTRSGKLLLFGEVGLREICRLTLPCTTSRYSEPARIPDRASLSSKRRSLTDDTTMSPSRLKAGVACRFTSSMTPTIPTVGVG